MIINRLYRYNLTYFLFPGSHKHLIRYQNILFIRINKKSISDYPWNYTAMERRNISFRLQSRKAQYIMKGGKVGRKTGYCKPKEEKAEQYSGILKLLSKNYPIKMVGRLSKLEIVSVNTVQRLKKEFCL